MDYLYSLAIQANSFHNNVAYKMVWLINRGGGGGGGGLGGITEYSLYYNIYGKLIIFIVF